MKFNKLLVEVRDAASPPEWAPYFLNYKLLKRCINGLGKERAAREGRSLPPGEFRAPQIRVVSGDSDEERVTGAGTLRESPPDTTEASPSSATSEINSNSFSSSGAHCMPEAAKAPAVLPTAAITSLPSERAFFQLLTAEFSKAATFYEEAERDMLARFGRVEEGVRQIVDEPLDADTSKLVLEATRRLTNDFIMLESFTVVTFSGVSKILKKHDKVTGFETRAKFMAHHVMQQPLVKCVVVKALVKHCEELFRTAVATCARLCSAQLPPAPFVASVRDRLEPPTPLSPPWVRPHHNFASSTQQASPLQPSSSPSQPYYPDADWNSESRPASSASPTPSSSSSSSSRSHHPVSNPSAWPPPPNMLQGSLSKSVFDGSSFYVNKFGSNSSSSSSSMDAGSCVPFPTTTTTPELRTYRSLSDSSGRRPSRSEEELVVSALLEIQESCARRPAPSSSSSSNNHASSSSSSSSSSFCRPQLKCAATFPSSSTSSSSLSTPSSSSQQPSWAMLPPPARVRGKAQMEGTQPFGEAIPASAVDPSPFPPFTSSLSSSASNSAEASAAAPHSHAEIAPAATTTPVDEASITKTTSRGSLNAPLSAPSSRAPCHQEGTISSLAHRWTAALLAEEQKSAAAAAATSSTAAVSGEVTCSEESGSSSAGEGSSGDGDDSGESEGGDDVSLVPTHKKVTTTSGSDSPKRKHSLPMALVRAAGGAENTGSTVASNHFPKRFRMGTPE